MTDAERGTDGERRLEELGQPVRDVDTGSVHAVAEEGIGLCLSGGGYRAMLFHAGALWRLYEADLLRPLRRISSVSGGSIAAALLGLCWGKLGFDPAHVRRDFVPLVVDPLRSLAGRTLDVASILRGLLCPASAADKLEAAYRKHLFGRAKLADLPDAPRFVINATNVQSGALWRFMKPYMRDYRVGQVPNPDVELARAVAASSAFPPVLSPLVMKLDDAGFTPGSGRDLQRPPYTTRVVLTDGGVYDNLGLETVWRRYRTVLVSDAGAAIDADPAPKTGWVGHGLRTVDMIQENACSVRKRKVVASFLRGTRHGAYWGIRSDLSHYGVAHPLPCPHDRTLALAHVPTRLKRLDETTQQRLINWGYAVCDAAARKYVSPGLAAPAAFPYPDAAV